MESKLNHPYNPVILFVIFLFTKIKYSFINKKEYGKKLKEKNDPSNQLKTIETEEEKQKKRNSKLLLQP